MKHIRLFFLFVGCMAFCRLALAQDRPSFLVKKEGSGSRSILFLPGFACSGDVWRETVKAYSTRYTCYTLTFSGFAGVPPQASPDMRQWVTDVAAYISAQGIVKPVIVGHSMGGGMALMLAARYPDLIGRIVVVDALPYLAAVMDTSFRSAPNPDCASWGARIAQMNESTFYAMQISGIGRLLADTTHASEVVHWSMVSDRQTLGRVYCQFSNLDLRDSLHTIACPTLILLEAPFAGMKPVMEAQYRSLSAASLRYAPKGLHFIMYDDPEWYKDQLEGFLQ